MGVITRVCPPLLFACKNMVEGYIKIYRKIMESSVWKNPNTLAVWIWCLLKANHKPNKFPFNGMDIELNAGEFISGRENACKEIKISPQTYRTCIKYLKSTSRITIKSTNRFSIFYIVNWEEYQKLTSKSTSKSNNYQPATNQLLTTNKNDKNDKNDKKSGTFSPPSLNDIKIYCKERNYNLDAEQFLNFYESKGWFVGKNKMKNWQAAVRTWENRNKQNNPKVADEKAIIPNYAKSWDKK